MHSFTTHRPLCLVTAVKRPPLWRKQRPGGRHSTQRKRKEKERKRTAAECQIVALSSMTVSKACLSASCFRVQMSFLSLQNQAPLTRRPRQSWARRKSLVLAKRSARGVGSTGLSLSSISMYVRMYVCVWFHFCERSISLSLCAMQCNPCGFHGEE